MKMPFAERALVPERKITEYLLNPHHPDGASKARYFLSFGYSLADPLRFRGDLLRLAVETEREETLSRFGTEYAGTGALTAPDGRVLRVRTAWILDGGNPPPRLITAYPCD
jgi:hypothetical protein